MATTEREKLPENARPLYDVIANFHAGNLWRTSGNEASDEFVDVSLQQSFSDARDWVFEQAPDGELEEVALTLGADWVKCACGGLDVCIRLRSGVQHRIVKIGFFGGSSEDVEYPESTHLYSALIEKVGAAGVVSASESILSACSMRSDGNEPQPPDGNMEQLGTNAYYIAMLLVAADALRLGEKGFSQTGSQVNAQIDGEDARFWVWRPSPAN